MIVKLEGFIFILSKFLYLQKFYKISANTEFNNSRLLREQMIGILNRRDNYGNTPLHYAKPYPNQNIVKLLLSFGAKLDLNQQGGYLEYT